MPEEQSAEPQDYRYLNSASLRSIEDLEARAHVIKKVAVGAGGVAVLLFGVGIVRNSVLGSGAAMTDSPGGVLVTGNPVISTDLSTKNSASYTNNTTITITADNFAQPGLPINLSPSTVQISSSGTLLSKKELPEDEATKIGRRHRLPNNEGMTFLNGYLGISVNRIESDKSRTNYANVTVKRLNPSNFNIKAGWSQDFITPYGKFTLTIESIDIYSVIASVYEMP